ncbi:hypothetical protein [Paraburkholderia sartisoli]|uniref:hypothetical protein n=1 Tax=Paraburkholderia sartisoli TaxID=83784 RepID=UPI000B8188DC|nr:hypothetical protein [Paraburkholderia sartisoli]
MRKRAPDALLQHLPERVRQDGQHARPLCLRIRKQYDFALVGCACERHHPTVADETLDAGFARHTAHAHVMRHQHRDRRAYFVQQKSHFEHLLLMFPGTNRP